ncbi:MULTISPECIES: hypothetical protein [Bacillaceae]|uniref:Uncharacterized protein n=2 Tax=Bacillaceae TaxID=186817 RepID=A0A7V7RI10_9BACI|nr:MULTISPECIES: hypothetical protein [Bacillaceae]KAB2329444.1 hypothetical protein F7732_21200 [Bacillus mesophilum]QVY63946.1 hypothetical protein J1899_22495 [Cytobacillus gottheilii]
MRRVHQERNTIRDVLWNIYLDQYETIFEECKDGKSLSEVVRRSIDFGMENQLNKKFKSNRDPKRSLRKVQINMTQKQYMWFESKFPNRKKSEGLRFVIDTYLKLGRV